MNLGDNMPTYQRDFQFPEDIWKTISKNIRKYRLQAGITQDSWRSILRNRMILRDDSSLRREKFIVR